MTETANSTPSATHNQPEFTVSELSQAVKSCVEERFSWVRVRGEISGFKRATSGHLYLNLKDDQAVLNAVCWKGVAASLPIQPEDGMEVICSGKLTTYPGRSNYQLVISTMEIAGEGALMALLEKRKKQLMAEGLFDPARKLSLPFMPQIIGVITSPTGAVIRDILHRISERFPTHVLVWPVAVQGDTAKDQIADAIHGFNQLAKHDPVQRPDVIIVARGGGSLEDLWAFNEEVVVRAAANSEIPIISAVGHETDTTLIDFAADKRAPTPTAAAEMAVPVREDWLMTVYDYQPRLYSSIQRLLEQHHSYISALSRGLISPRQMLDTMTQRLDERVERLLAALPNRLNQAEQQLTLTSNRLQPTIITNQILRLQDRITYHAKLLESYHYKKVLARGYAMVRDGKGTVITSTGKLKNGQAITLELQDGEAHAVIGKPTKKASGKKKGGEQQSLF